MSQTLSINYTYDVKALDRRIRRTNNLLRLLNSARATVQDLKNLADDPTLAELFWTLMQLYRTFTALRRLLRGLQGETRGLFGTARLGLKRAPPSMGMGVLEDPRFAFQRADIFQRLMQDVGLIGINVDATINYTPVPISRIDLSNIPELTTLELQQIMEEEAPRIVMESKQLLRQRILHPERSTGRLESSIQWTSQLPGVTVEATAPYSFWVEEGHDNFAGHHYLRDVLPDARMRITAKIVSRLNQLIRDGRVK